MRRLQPFTKYVATAAYVLLGAVIVFALIAISVGEVALIYVAGAVYAVVLLGFVLPASGVAIDEKEDIGRAVVALLVSLLVIPTVLTYGFVASAASSITSDLEDTFGEDSEDFSEEPVDYGDATTPEECEEVWFSDFSDNADSARDDCVDRVGR